ncbi:MAG: permease [Bacillota bacterium]|nr:permease [Bacillota bacterium]
MKLYIEFYTILHLIIFQFKTIFPYWIAGVFIGSLLSVFATEKINTTLAGINGEKYSIFWSLTAAMLGVASPICMYGTIPLIASLGRKGVPQYILATFMISSILLNPNLLFLSFSLGVPLALTRLLSSILAGILAGLFVKIFFKRKTLFRYEDFEEKKKPRIDNIRLIHLLKDLNKSINITAPYFLFGILITALFDRYFPKDWIVSLFGANKGLGVLFASSLGVPLYVCGGGTIPIVKSWLEAGMSPGSATAFMLSGPATKLTNLSAVKIILGAKNYVLYITFNILYSIIVGFIVDVLFWSFK